jgi:hypothetical protein
MKMIWLRFLLSEFNKIEMKNHYKLKNNMLCHIILKKQNKYKSMSSKQTGQFETEEQRRKRE